MVADEIDADKISALRGKVAELESFLEAIEVIEKRLFKATRTLLPPLPSDELREIYVDALKGGLLRVDVAVDHLLELLNNDLLGSISFGEPTLDVQVSTSSRTVTYDTGIHSITVPDANLLWECNCRYEFPGFLGQPCPIHSRECGAHIHKSFAEGVVDIHYPPVTVAWQDHRGLWPPSVDTFAMITNLKQSGISRSAAASVLDLGCGTGFLGIWFARENPSIRSVFFADWLLSPLLCSYTNACRNLSARTTTRKYLLGLCGAWLNSEHHGPKKKVDILLCNPPYLPAAKCYPELMFESAVSGTDLLSFVIENGHTLARSVVVSFSDLALIEAHAAAERAGCRLCQVGSDTSVPFRIPKAFANKEYLGFLRERGLLFRPDARYPFWHTLRTYHVINEAETPNE